MVAVWMGNGAAMPRAARERASSAGTPSDSKVGVAATSDDVDAEGDDTDAPIACFDAPGTGQRPIVGREV